MSQVHKVNDSKDCQNDLYVCFVEQTTLDVSVQNVDNLFTAEFSGRILKSGLFRICVLIEQRYKSV